MTRLEDLKKVPIRYTSLAVGYVALAEVPLAWRERGSATCAANRGKLITPTVGEAVFEGDWSRWLSSLTSESA